MNDREINNLKRGDTVIHIDIPDRGRQKAERFLITKIENDKIEIIPVSLFRNRRYSETMTLSRNGLKYDFVLPNEECFYVGDFVILAITNSDNKPELTTAVVTEVSVDFVKDYNTFDNDKHITSVFECKEYLVGKENKYIQNTNSKIFRYIDKFIVWKTTPHYKWLYEMKDGINPGMNLALFDHGELCGAKIIQINNVNRKNQYVCKLSDDNLVTCDECCLSPHINQFSVGDKITTRNGYLFMVSEISECDFYEDYGYQYRYKFVCILPNGSIANKDLWVPEVSVYNDLLSYFQKYYEEEDAWIFSEMNYVKENN